MFRRNLASPFDLKMEAAVVAAGAVSTEETNALKIFEMKTVREIYGAVKH
jgi:hypothetical protein